MNNVIDLAFYRQKKEGPPKKNGLILLQEKLERIDNLIEEMKQIANKELPTKIVPSQEELQAAIIKESYTQVLSNDIIE